MKNLDYQLELTKKLREAADAYYNTGHVTMSDKEYDELFDELTTLEIKNEHVFEGSVTQNVGAVPVSALAKIKHASKMLSLAKTKSEDEIANWLNDQAGCLSWKMDGLTIVLTYENGELVQAVTRGNGEIGDDITHNAPFIHGVPKTIPDKNKLVIRGEAVIHYDDFEKINKEEDSDSEYKNPRNLCSGTIRALNPLVLKKRPVHFYAFELVSGYDSGSFSENLNYLNKLGFSVVEKIVTDGRMLKQNIHQMRDRVQKNLFPSDGLVLQYNDTAYGKSLGITGHHPKSAIAFKWQDETAETTLRQIEWSASATGRLNPVAVFDPVELEGTTVSRASVHNCSIVEKLKLKIGDRITVYKANMIIPQIDENLTMTPDYHLPDITCPICGTHGIIQVSDDGIKIAYCPNETCPAKMVGRFERFVCRDAMNITGMSAATIEKLIQTKCLMSIGDVFRLDKHTEIKDMEGFGERSYEKLLQSIRKAASEATLDRVLYAMCIPNIGRTASKDICRRYNKPESLSELSKDDLCIIRGIGEELAESFVRWFSDDDNIATWNDVLSCVTLKQDHPKTSNEKIAGKTFVVTGSVNHYKNRDELKAAIEQAGGKVTGSVSKNTDYLINNDITSTSGKNKKAKELGIPIITEETFCEMMQTDNEEK